MGTVNYLFQGWNGSLPSDGLDLAGDATTGGNTGALSVTKLGGGSAKFKAFSGFGQTFCAEFTNGAGNAATGRFPFGNASNTVSTYIDWVCPTLPTTSSNITLPGAIRNSTGPRVLTQLTQAGKILALCNGVTVGAGAFPAAADPQPSAVMVPGNLYRTEVTVTGSPTVATGTVSVRVYNFGAAATDYLGGVTSSSAATAIDAFVSVDTGMSSYAETRTVRIGIARLVDGAAVWGGPYAAPTAATSPFDLVWTGTAWK